MPQRGELAQAQRQPQGTLRAPGLGAAKEDGVPRTVGQHGLQVLLYPTPCTAPFGTSKVSCTEKPQNELAYVGEMQLGKFRREPTLTPGGLLGVGRR